MVTNFTQQYNNSQHSSQSQYVRVVIDRGDRIYVERKGAQRKKRHVRNHRQQAPIFINGKINKNPLRQIKIKIKIPVLDVFVGLPASPFVVCDDVDQQPRLHDRGQYNSRSIF